MPPFSREHFQTFPINHFSFDFNPELIEGPSYSSPNPFPKQAHTKTHAGTYDGQNHGFNYIHGINRR